MEFLPIDLSSEVDCQIWCCTAIRGFDGGETYNTALSFCWLYKADLKSEDEPLTNCCTSRSKNYFIWMRGFFSSIVNWARCEKLLFFYCKIFCLGTVGTQANPTTWSILPILSGQCQKFRGLFSIVSNKHVPWNKALFFLNIHNDRPKAFKASPNLPYKRLFQLTFGIHKWSYFRVF